MIPLDFTGQTAGKTIEYTVRPCAKHQHKGICSMFISYAQELTPLFSSVSLSQIPRRGNT